MLMVICYKSRLRKQIHVIFFKLNLFERLYCILYVIFYYILPETTTKLEKLMEALLSYKKKVQNRPQVGKPSTLFLCKGARNLLEKKFSNFTKYSLEGLGGGDQCNWLLQEAHTCVFLR